MNKYPDTWPVFFTATIVEWKYLLNEDRYKDILIGSLRFLIEQRRIRLFSFVIMSNHIHLIWQALPGFTQQKNQLSFMKFTAQQIKFDLIKHNPVLLETFRTGAKDREYQFWKRKALSIDLFTPAVFNQKMNYIHQNPVKAGLCKLPEDYPYSSAAYYYSGKDIFGLFQKD